MKKNGKVQLIKDALNNAVFMRKFHYWAALIWFLAAIPICIWLKDSVPFLVFISVYAVVVSHWSSGQAASVEVKQDLADEANPNT